MILQTVPILATGGINPSWVLTGVVSIMIFLLWNMLLTMKREIKENTATIDKLNIIVGAHHIHIEYNGKRLDAMDKDFHDIKERNAKLAEDIIDKLRAARG
tara:strand:- start:808 stop:1110 length:303 start_codon:yes stop_codon:yes gene_type:complete